ncbi:MAG TPA: NUDIX domain-containing protein [Gemmatimonadales bacterium]|nr:NUDIX domain-containing protein [Gemmatimonadales bacterium]
MSKRRAELEVSAGGIVFRRVPGEPARYLLIRDSYNNWGFPKGHLEQDESPAQAALRETAEETGLSNLVLHGPIRVIDWHFRFRGRHIHKYCHFFLFESQEGDVCPQVDEGITACQWRPLGEALEILSYDNARGVLKRAGEMVRTLVAVGAGRGGARADGRTGRQSSPEGTSISGAESMADNDVVEANSNDPQSAGPPVRQSAGPPP